MKYPPHSHTSIGSECICGNVYTSSKTDFSRMLSVVHTRPWLHLRHQSNLKKKLPVCIKAKFMGPFSPLSPSQVHVRGMHFPDLQRYLS
jgi:hypothetical protein